MSRELIIGDTVLVNGCTDCYGVKYNGKTGKYLGDDGSNGKQKHRIKFNDEFCSCKWLFTEFEITILKQHKGE